MGTDDNIMKSNHKCLYPDIYIYIYMENFDVLLTVHFSIFILVTNQLDAQNFVLQQVYFMPLKDSSTCAHHQEVKIVLEA